VPNPKEKTMTIVPVKDLDQNDLDLLGDNVQHAIKRDHDPAAMARSMACREEVDESPPRCRARGRTHPDTLAKGAR